MANREKYNINDDEFRIIGFIDPESGERRKRQMPERQMPVSQSRAPGFAGVGCLITVVVIIIIIVITVINIVSGSSPRPRPRHYSRPVGVYEPVPEVAAPVVVSPIGIQTDESFTERLETVVNDVRLSIYLPHNARPELIVGALNGKDKSIILAAQAADIRKDNKKILGAFVLKGEPVAWGLSKKGFCAIIDSTVTVGVSENTSLFEEATEKGGYFFRQYALVDNGVLVENELKNKTMRKALCSRAGQIFVAVSETDESMHDFAQALVDYGVENAIYLVGSHTSLGWYVDSSGQRTLFTTEERTPAFKNENYIVWRKE